MNKKTTLIFVAGIVCGAVAFALAGALLPKPPNSAFVTPAASSESSIDTKTPSTFKPPAPVPPGIQPEASLQSLDTPLFRSLVSKEADGHSAWVEVKKGDSLTRIARSHGTTVELLRRVNQLSSDNLSVGEKLKIPNYKFNLVVDKSQNLLILKGDEEVLKSYVVSTGANNSTPVGVFKVTDKLINPTWFKSGAVVPYGSPANVLGTRWIGLSKKGYGIHGTTEPEKLGRQVTAGCVRMRNEEVEELFGFVVPGTEVTIVNGLK